MLGANISTSFIASQVAAKPSPYATKQPVTMTPATTNTSPTWVPWAVGAVIGGAVLYFLVRE